jgi:hypothetical protein
LYEGLITLHKHACFGGAVSFHEHRSKTCDVTMRLAVYAPPRRVLDPAVAQEQQAQLTQSALQNATGHLSCCPPTIHRTFIVNSSPCVSMAPIEVAGLTE